MAATGQSFTQTLGFGITNGPNYSGVITVPAPGTGTDTPRLYSAQCLNSATTTIDASGFVYTNFLAMGFKVVNDPVQTGTPTPTQLAAATVVIHLVDGLSGGSTDLTISVGQGQSVSYVAAPALLAHDVTSITVHGDSVVDCDVYGILLLSS